MHETISEFFYLQVQKPDHESFQARYVTLLSSTNQHRCLKSLHWGTYIQILQARRWHVMIASEKLNHLNGKKDTNVIFM
jgi:hypothetical protein